MKKILITTGIVISILSMFVLAFMFGSGYFSYAVTLSDAQKTPYSVIQGDYLDDYVFAYYDDAGEQQYLNVCSYNSCTSDDGRITFDYSTYKGVVSGRTITVGETTYNVKCGWKDGNVLTTIICLPNGTAS